MKQGSALSLPRAACVGILLTLLAPNIADAQQGGRQRQGPPEARGIQEQSATPAGEQTPSASSALPPDKTTSHSIRTSNGEMAFTATAGTIPLFNERTGAVSARIGYIAFLRTGMEPKSRPVTFAWNGGPGYASAWLNLGGLGPWRLDLEAAAANPSTPPAVVDNADTWLEFTDLVFLDPAGTGFGRIAGGDEASKQFWSVNGDIASLTAAVRRWLVNNGRMLSPKYLAGESYGGFRAPKIAHQLITDEGVGVNGMILISPVLDFGRFRSGGVLSHVARLPSYAATAREKSAPVTRAALADVEAYAQGEYLADLMRGLKDQAALARLTDNVSRFTGLERSVVARLAGRVPANLFAREIHAREGRVASAYDGSTKGLDPNPFSRSNEAEDQLLRGLHAPLVSAMVDLHQNRLQWMAPDGRYIFQNKSASSQWDWGNRNHESTSELARSLALTPGMRAQVVHGLTDLVTPYFETKMVLDQMPPVSGPERLKFEVYPGGHMFYSRETSRKAFRDDARALIAASSGALAP